MRLGRLFLALQCIACGCRDGEVMAPPSAILVSIGEPIRVPMESSQRITLVRSTQPCGLVLAIHESRRFEIVETRDGGKTWVSLEKVENTPIGVWVWDRERSPVKSSTRMGRRSRRR